MDKTQELACDTLVNVVVAIAIAAGSVALARAEEIKIGGTGGALATMEMLGQAYAAAHPGTKVTVLPSLGSSGGIKAVRAGAIDVGVSSRPLKQKETETGLVAFEYGRTPFVFATHSQTKAEGIQLKEIANIYANKLEKWPDGKLIRIVLRPVGDSDSDMVKSISEEIRQAKLQAETRPGMLFAVTDQDSATNIESIEGSFGTNTLSQILSEKRSIKSLKLDGVAPSAAAIANGSYRFYKRLFIVTRPDSAPSAKRFVAFVRSAEGRAILAQTEHWIP